ncbi:MAG: 3-oxoacyl-[acyl-carrier protein] reductase [Frankiales bacterium]|nr:3-oxoacyl-[acyl-carrier protein] reductase [Frankiales bacterium]
MTLSLIPGDPTRRALVTGGTGGIGGAIVALLIERGVDVDFTYRSNAEKAAELTAKTGARGISLDLTSDDVAVVVGELDLDIVVYASGPHIPMSHLSGVTPEAMRTQLLEDTSAFYALVHAALPSLRRNHGNVVAVTTAATSRFATRDGLSSIPKAAVEAAVVAFAKEEGRFGVRFNSVGPGMLSDGMAERLIANGDLDDVALAAARKNIPLKTFGTARDIAEAVCFLASDAAGYISGQKLDVDGGYGC